VISSLRRRPQSQEWADLGTFCLFVGYPRSGHSLVGSLLDAHPDVTLALGANALNLVREKGLSRRELFETLLENARAQAERQRRHGGYSYAVEGQWQGRVRTLRVIGDKSGKKTADRLRRDPSALTALERMIRLPVRFVHVVRNPYDTIARMTLITSRGEAEHSVSSATAVYARLADTVEDLIRGGRPVYTSRHETLLVEPHSELRRLCAFLGVDAGDGYLDACAAILFAEPRRTREQIVWEPDELDEIERLVAHHEFLHGYSWAGGE
jgi:Sulfotransferase family